MLSAALVVASLGPPKTAAAALRQQEQHAKRLPGGLPGGAAGLLASGGLLSLGGSLMTGSAGAGSNGSVAVAARSAAAPAVPETASVLGRELPAWATKSAGHGGSALGDKTGSLHFVGAILLDDMKQVIRL